MAIRIIVQIGKETTTMDITLKVKTIGRSSKCNLVIQDDHVSGRHLAIKRNDKGKILVKDLGSTNGTNLNNTTITESYLKVNDLLTIGPNVKITIDSNSLNSQEKTSIGVNPRQKPGLAHADEEANNATSVMKTLRDAGGNTILTKEEKEKKEKEKKEKEEQKKKSEEPQASVKRTGIKTSLSEVVKKPEEDMSAMDSVMDLEESSGKTQFLKIDIKKKKVEPAKKKKKKKKKKVEKKEENLKDKILSIFKK